MDQGEEQATGEMNNIGFDVNLRLTIDTKEEQNF